MTRIPRLLTAVSTVVTVAVSASVACAQLARITPSDAFDNDDFGKAVAIDGDLMVIGSTNDDNSGSIYLFDPSTGQELGKLLSPDTTPNAQFGAAVAIQGNLVVVGAPRSNELSFLSGIAYVIDVTDPTPPAVLHTLLPDDTGTGDSFGESVGIDGDTVIVGGSGWRAAYLFSATTGLQLARLSPSDDEIGDDTGFAVAIQGDLAWVASPFDDIELGPFNTRVNAGSVTAFDITNPVAPAELGKFTAFEPNNNERFGHSLAIDGSTLLVGAPYADDIPFFVDNGAVFVFDASNPGTPTLQLKLRADNPRTTSQLGWSVSIEGALTLAGAPNGDADLTTNGLGYLFDATTGAQIARLQTDPLSQFTNRLGEATALSGGIAAIGAPLDGNPTLDPGAVYLFGASSPCPGDASGDGMVDLADLNLVLANFGTTNPAGDANGDGTVDLADLNLVLGNFGTAC